MANAITTWKTGLSFKIDNSNGLSMTGEIWKRIRTGLFKRKRTGVSRVLHFFGGRTSAFEWHPQNSSFTFQFHLYPCILSQCWWVWGHLKKGLKVEWEVPLHSLKGKINGMAYCIIIIIFLAKHNYICTWREGRKFTTLKALHPASILTLHFRTLEIGRKTKILILWGEWLWNEGQNFYK